MVFILPSIVKLEHHLHHHHEKFECKAKHEKHYHIFHEKCSICTFTFSVFSSSCIKVALTKKYGAAKDCNEYISANFSPQIEYSFLLRAPPYELI
jgi:hypothetical protein